jgi:hypothetical protein
MTTIGSTVSLLEQWQSEVEPDILDLLRKPLAEVLAQTNSLDQWAGGLALEALAFKLMDLLDMQFAAARSHWGPTEENDTRLIIEFEQPVFSRWQVQCKNTELLAVDDVAIEVGLTYLLKSNVIVMISTGAIEDTARLYADKVMRTSNLCIVMLDRTDLDRISADPMHIKRIFRRETRRTKGLRPLDI